MKKFIFGFTLALASMPSLIQAGGPWLVYKSTYDGVNTLLVLNLGYDAGPEFAFTETDPDEETWLEFNPSPKNKKIWKHIYDGNDDSDSSMQNQWHRLSWGRKGNTFGLIYSQYEVVGSSGTTDHGVFFGTGSCVPWPNGKNSIGITGLYPKTLKFQTLRLGGSWQGNALGNGSRTLEQASWTGTLDVALTKALNGVKDSLNTNLDAKNWIISYFVNTLGYTQTADQND